MPPHTRSIQTHYSTREGPGPGRLTQPCFRAGLPTLLVALAMLLVPSAGAAAQGSVGRVRVATATPKPSATPLPTCPYTPIPTPAWNQPTDTPVAQPTSAPTATLVPGMLEILAWQDGNGNGIRDDGEPGWPGLLATVRGRPVLLGDDGVWSGEAPPGPVSLAVQLPAGSGASTAPSLETDLTPAGHVALHVGIGLSPADTPTPSHTASPTWTPRPPKLVDVTVAPTAAATLRPSATPTATPTASATATSSLKASRTATPSVAPTAVAGSGITLACPPPVVQTQDLVAAFPTYECMLALGLLALAVLMAGERVRAALRRQEQAQYGLGLQQLALQRAALGRSIAVAPEELLDTVNRIVFDVLGEPVGMDQLVDVSAEPPLAVTFARQAQRFFAFTPQPDRARPFYPGGHWFAVDALTAHPFVSEELAAVYCTAMAIRSPGQVALQPRSEQWGLVVWELSQKAPLDRLRMWLRSKLPWPRWWLRRAREVGK
ncbi:MAG TPA: hypothetical protein VM537_01025 [Anaerolineae bacterium]|nr:hypothetical protein [Anaerolineae bacterium]